MKYFNLNSVMSGVEVPADQVPTDQAYVIMYIGMAWRFPTDQSYVIKYSQGMEVPTDQVSTDQTYVTRYSQGVEVPNNQSYVIKFI